MVSTSSVLGISSSMSDDLEHYQPTDCRDFLLTLNIMVSFHGDDWGGDGELFRLTVCTPSHLYKIVLELQPAFLLSGYLVVDQYDWPTIKTMLMRQFDGITAESTFDLMLEFSRYALYAG